MGAGGGTRYRDDAWTEIQRPGRPLEALDRDLRRGILRAGGSGAGSQPVGAFGMNEHGIQDLSGNVWEWTSSCYVRHRLDTGTEAENCGVRIAEGRHRAYMIAFFRDPKAGACSVGIPPANLGVRLVRDGAAGFPGSASDIRTVSRPGTAPCPDCRRRPWAEVYPR